MPAIKLITTAAIIPHIAYLLINAHLCEAFLFFPELEQSPGK
jgi:hypothetical protein